MFRGRLLVCFILMLLATANIEEKYLRKDYSGVASDKSKSETPKDNEDTRAATCTSDSKCANPKHPHQFGKPSQRTTDCVDIPANINICPEGFKTFSRNGEMICYVLNERQTFPPPCPYPNFLPFYRLKQYLRNNFVDAVIWVNAKRNPEGGFPDFEWVENGLHYGQTLSEDLTNPNDVKDKNCIVSMNGHLRRVSCDERYSSLCMYSMDDLQNSYLGICNSSEYSQCIFGHYDLTSPKCFCKKTDRSQPPRKKFCKKLVEPISPFQTKLMSKYFSTDSSMCWTGLNKEAQGSSVNYKWLSTGNNVEYTKWAKPEDCRFSQGAFKFSSEPYGGWALTRDRTLKCAVCEFTKQPEQTSLELKYVTSKGEVEVIVNNHESISTSDGFNLYCFSDSNSDGFKIGIPVVSMGQAKMFRLQDIAHHPSYYWCEAFQFFSNQVIKSNKIIAYNGRNGYGNEFAVHLSVEVPTGIDPFLNEIHMDVVANVLNRLRHLHSIQNLRPMRAEFDATTMYIILHLTTVKGAESVNNQHKKFANALNGISTDYPTITMLNLLSSEVCLASTTQTEDEQTLEWPETKIGATAIPRNIICLDETQNLAPVTRKCEGDFLGGAKWSDPDGTCSKDTTYSETTRELFNLVHGEISSGDITTDLIRITQQNVNNEPIDVHLMSSVLERLVVEFNGEVACSDFAKIISNIMNFEEATVKKAQNLLNSTDKILSTLDDYLKGVGSLSLVTPKLVVQTTDLGAEVSGLALYSDKPSPGGFQSYTITPLFRNTTFNEVIAEEFLEIAVMVPEDALLTKQGSKLVITVFYNDLLFNEKEGVSGVHENTTKIISVFISGFSGGSLGSSIQMAFKLPQNYSGVKNCSYWNYGLDTNMLSVHGKWQKEGLSQPFGHSMEVCEFPHMTHFGLLLPGGVIEGPIKRSLEILIILGSSLSLIGIIPIFLTACLFKSWRCRSGNIILLNFCIAITAQIMLTFLLFSVEDDGVVCTILGAALHYIDLSEFCWMFIIAVLQYRRFVTVFRSQQDRLVGKCVLFGWTTPIFPVVVTMSISTENYRINSAGYCYVVDDYFTYGCLLPISIILCVNAFIFIAIMYSISRQNAASILQTSHNYKLEILLALFLFFTLGMTWMFCFAGMLGGGIVFTYIFCATSTLRGLVLFLFFILGNKEIRQLWNKRFSYYVSKERRESGIAKSSNAGTLSSE